MERQPIPVAIIGAGPIGLAVALELERFHIPFKIFEEDVELSTKPKAGTILPRSLEIFSQEGIIDEVLQEGLRFDEVHFIDRTTDKVLMRMLMHPMGDESLYPFIVNLPQSDLEHFMANQIEKNGQQIALGFRLESVSQNDQCCHLTFSSLEGPVEIDALYVLACDGGHSTVRRQLDIAMEGITHPERFLVADFEVDLDRREGRQLTYLSYIFDPDEWVIFVRQPHFWRFLIPIPDGADEPPTEAVLDKVRGVVKNADLRINLLDMGIYHVHHRTAAQWQSGRIFLLGDAAHLITPVGGLGLNTGMQDANNLGWKLAWVLGYHADPVLLKTYEAERAPIARFNARNQADRNRDMMRMQSPIQRTVRNVVLGWMDRAEGLQWQAAHTRSLLGTSYNPLPKTLSLWSRLHASRKFTRPPVEAGDRVPDGDILGHDGKTHRLHDLFREGFAAIILLDPRKRPVIDPDPEGLHQYFLHRFDAAFDTRLRTSSLYDKGGRITQRLGVPPGFFVLIRPDGHIAAIAPFSDASSAIRAYQETIKQRIDSTKHAASFQLG